MIVDPRNKNEPIVHPKFVSELLKRRSLPEDDYEG